MYIEKLVLDNFKSFGRKTEIPFYEDFTTISGPNGSGKSNIIDAILFCLGLSRSSRIRAEKLTDLIYNPGTESNSPPPNEATVEVILNNTDGYERIHNTVFIFLEVKILRIFISSKKLIEIS